MKLSGRLNGESYEVEIRGIVDGDSCHCLDHFLTFRLPDDPIRVKFDMSHLEVADQDGALLLAQTLDTYHRRGHSLALNQAPELLVKVLQSDSSLLSEVKIIR